MLDGSPFKYTKRKFPLKIVIHIRTAINKTIRNQFGRLKQIMFGFMQKLSESKYYKQLDEIIEHIEMNMSNNYKDAAQQDLREFGELLKEMQETGKISKGKLSYYENKFSMFKEKMKNYTHKDQKPFW